MRLLPGGLEVVRCAVCAREQILHGRTCGACGGLVEELFGEPVGPAQPRLPFEAQP